MAKYNKELDRYFLENGDKLIAKNVDLKFKDGDYVLAGLSDAEIFYWDEGEEKDHLITYATDLPKKNSDYGKPYYKKYVFIP